MVSDGLFLDFSICKIVNQRHTRPAHNGQRFGRVTDLLSAKWRNSNFLARLLKIPLTGLNMGICITIAGPAMHLRQGCERYLFSDTVLCPAKTSQLDLINVNPTFSLSHVVDQATPPALLPGHSQCNGSSNVRRRKRKRKIRLIFFRRIQPLQRSLSRYLPPNPTETSSKTENSLYT